MQLQHKFIVGIGFIWVYNPVRGMVGIEKNTKTHFLVKNAILKIDLRCIFSLEKQPMEDRTINILSAMSNI